MNTKKVIKIRTFIKVKQNKELLNNNFQHQNPQQGANQGSSF